MAPGFFSLGVRDDDIYAVGHAWAVMVLWIEVLTLLALVVIFVLMPVLLAVLILILSRRRRGLFEKIGFSRKEIGLLVFGALASSRYLAIDVPVIVFRDYFLAVNVAGAAIPVILSIHLLRAKRIPWPAWSLGVLGISLITFLLTRVQPNSGIVAEFPWLFLPSLAAAAVALILFSRRSAKAPAYAYATATLGGLIGADIFHLPELFEAPEFVGSIGGAGVYDLVYLAGLLSLAMVLLLARGQIRAEAPAWTPGEVAARRVAQELEMATRAYQEGRPLAAIQRALVAVQERASRAVDASGAGTAPQLALAFGDAKARHAYELLLAKADAREADEESARWAFFQAEYLLEHLELQERERFASIARRVGAFAIDGGFMFVVMVALGLLLFSARGLFSNTILVLTLLYWAWSIQLIYFTLFEYFWKGQTPGKRWTGIRTVTLDGDRPDFITVFTRNVVRVLDFALLFYFFSLLSMMAGRRVQRIGDMVADTVVMRVPPGPPAQGAA
jgi:uncharacterized RDD family membrane protein YckC